MTIGATFPSESRIDRDPQTGALVRQVTTFEAIHHHPFYYIPAYDSDHRLFFVSQRTGRPQLYFENGRGGSLVQITDRPDLDEWSCHPALDNRYAYYTAANRGWRVDLETMREESVADFTKGAIPQAGMVGSAMRTTSLSTDSRWWCVFIKLSNRYRMHVVDTVSGENSVILESDAIAHPQFHPDDPTILRYAGAHDRRVWTIRRDGSENQLAYLRNDAAKEWIVHESWLPGTREIVTTNWPHGVMAIDVDTRAVRWIIRTNAWHPMVNRGGTQCVADTTNPDRGLLLFDPRIENDKATQLCASNASNLGDHWKCDHCPYDDGPVGVYAPQHTHPHPSFSPDSTHVVFTSDCTGFAQVYEVELPASV